MSNIRFRALEHTVNRHPVKVTPPSNKVSDYFGINVFNKDAMHKFLPRDAYKAVMDAIEQGERIDRKIADHVALGMKEWATSKGASHYTHWFQPLTGATAEKHDSFFEVSFDGKALEHFSGGALTQQEPDASSFPSGGIRNTFEARGYTAWDPSSPAFIIESANGKTLCIPTIFVSYTGETLDYKAPLLKALHALDKAAVDVCQYFDKNVTKVFATLGIEQEYFLVDTALYNSRPDLTITGRTVFGHSPAKGQQLEDHYFGSIPDRVYAFMHDFEIEAFKLGIPLKTRHNEVAPSQFECAPVFEEINLAVDHNALLMDLMDKVAHRHNFKVLLHEKPYAGINGSGKHNNWSIGTNTGKNLLSPGSTPKSNMQFLTFFVNTIKAVHDNADLLRASIASASNDHRLGANEAPPAIMSIFIGGQLSKALDEIESSAKSAEGRTRQGEEKKTNMGKARQAVLADAGDVYDENEFETGENGAGKRDKKMSPEEKTALKLNIGKIPEILLDNTDRNRTSPFAFTGNKFEFRAVGSSANSSNPMMVLNTIVANQLRQFKTEVDAVIGKGAKKDEAILKVLRQYIIDSKNIRFEGNNYSEEWMKEAGRRGLSNITTTPPALDAFVSKKSLNLFEETGVFNHREIEARHDIMLETYIKKLQIEARVIGDLAINHVIPAAVNYQTRLVESVQGLKNIGMKPEVYGAQSDMIQEIAEHITAIKTKTDELVNERKKANRIGNMRDKAIAYCDKVRPYFDAIRQHVDKLEMMVDDELWPLAKYRELVTIR